MLSVRRARLPIRGPNQDVAGHLEIGLLPRTAIDREIPALVEDSAETSAAPELPRIQLLEGCEYRFTIDLPVPLAGRRITVDPREVFEADTEAGDQGRLRPGLYTGTLSTTVLVDNRPIGEVQVEVRSRKLNYLADYRWMLRDVADQVAEVVMERFAPTEQRFSIDESADAATLYQRFAFLKSILADDTLDAALHQVTTRPHVSWEDVEEARAPQQGLRMSSGLARQVMSGGRRVPIDPSASLPMSSIPARLIVDRTEATVDTVANRFVKFALQRWRHVLLAIRDGMVTAAKASPVERGVREIEGVTRHLDELLGEELFREVGDLNWFPGGNQVLQKREGYRDIFRAYLQFELAAKLAWSGGDDVYRAGQRDVATLYEYWSFLQLAGIVAELGNAPFDFSSLIEVDRHGIGLSLKRGRVTMVSGSVERLGRRLHLDLSFNRTFTAGTGSWSRDMRPDCSLEIRPEVGSKDFDPVWLHFDAKYRVENLTEVLGSDDEAVTTEAKRDDLLKMHAYRDAIKRSGGAYVLYPGSAHRFFKEYHELLPGLGAFALRPSETGETTGSSGITKFIEDVLTHVATQVSQHERGRYWNRVVYERPTFNTTEGPVASFIDRPPADTIVLLGYVRGKDQMEWIQETGLYNLRAGGRRGAVGLRSAELAADLLILYGRGTPQPAIWEVCGPPELRTRADMKRLGYPRPRGDAYYCIPIRRIDAGLWEGRLTTTSVSELINEIAPHTRPGQPVATSWERIAGIGA